MQLKIVILRHFYTISYLSDYHATLFVGLYQILKVVVFGSLKYTIFFFFNCIACSATYDLLLYKGFKKMLEEALYVG